VIAEVVIVVAIHDVECHSSIKLTEILPPMKDEINDVKIAVTCAAASYIVKTKQRHSGSKMNATAFCCSMLNFALHIEM
jgi:hypothetical protein